MIKQNQAEVSEMGHTTQQVKTSVESLNNERVRQKKTVSKLEDSGALSQAKKSIQELRNTMWRPNIRVTQEHGGVEREAGFKNIFREVVKENLPNTEK